MLRARFIAGSLAFASLPRIATAATLHHTLDGAVRRIPGESGIYACTMAGESPLFSHNARESFPSASVIKLVVMLTAFVREDTHPGTLAERIVTRRTNLIGGSDFLAQQPDGAAFSLLQLVRPMITVSDNSAANALITHLGIAEIDRVGKAAGLTGTHLRRHFMDFAAVRRHEDNVTTARDMAHLLFQIERGAREAIPTIASVRSCLRMVRILLGQTDDEGIPAGVLGIPVANKTGAVSFTRNDVGIVDPFGPSPFVVAILTKRLRNYSGAYVGMQRISRALYRHLAGSDL